MLILDVDADELADIAQKVGATEAIARTAARRAMRRTIRHVAGVIVRDVSKATDIPGKVIRERMRIRMPRNGGDSAALWIGLDPINPLRIGAKQTRKGVRARRHSFEGAFIARGRGGSHQVFKRQGRGRLPLEVMRVHSHDEALRVIRGRTFAEASDFFMRQFDHELRWGLQNAG